MINSFRPIALVSTLMVSGLSAQTPATTSILPANPIATLHFDGPAALRAAFLPTNMGRMFAGPEFNDMVAPFMGMLEGIKGQMGQEAPFDLDALEAAVIDYRGRLTVGLNVLDESIDFDGDEPNIAFTVALTPDGDTDLAAMCQALADLAEEEGGDELSEMGVGGVTLTTVDTGEPFGFTLPFMHKGHAVLLISNDVEMAAEALLDEGAEVHAPDAGFAKNSIGLSINVKTIADLAYADLEQGEPVATSIMDIIGLRSLDSVDVTIGASGPAILSETSFTFNNNDRGLLGELLTGGGQGAGLIDLLPRNAATASAMPLNMGGIYEQLMDLVDKVGEAEGNGVNADMLESEFEGQFGLRLKEDFFDTFSSGLLMTSLESLDAPVGPLAAVEGMSLGLGVRDGAKLSQTIDSLLREAGLHAGRKSTEYRDYTVYSMNIMMMLPLEYTVTDELLLVGLGETGGDAVRAVLDEAKDRAEGKEPAPFPKGVADRLRMVQGGWAGLGWADMGAQMSVVGDQLAMAMEMAGGAGGDPSLDILQGLLDALPPLFEKYELQHTVSVIRVDGNRWTQSSIW